MLCAVFWTKSHHLADNILKWIFLNFFYYYYFDSNQDVWLDMMWISRNELRPGIHYYIITLYFFKCKINKL